LIDLTVYRKLLADPALARTIAWSLPARLPLGMNGLALVLTTQQLTGSYASAGLVSGSYLTGCAGAAPLIGRLVDQRGPGFVVPLCAALSGLALLAIALLPFIPFAGLLALAALAGATQPPVTSLIRAMWQKAPLAEADRRAALSLDATILETTFMFGPVLVGAFMAWGAPRWACAASAVIGTVGVGLFLRAGGVGKWGRVETQVARHPLGPLQSSAFLCLLVACFCLATAFSSNELVFAAFTQAIGIPGAVGWLFFAAGLASGVASLAFGSRSFALSLPRLFIVFALYTAVTFALMALATSLPSMLVLALLSGVGVGPAIATLYTLAGRYSQTRYATEAMTWMISVLLVGLGVGQSLGGIAVATWGWKWTAVISALPAVVAAAIALGLPKPVANPSGG
jgi:MFS family permease